MAAGAEPGNRRAEPAIMRQRAAAFQQWSDVMAHNHQQFRQQMLTKPWSNGNGQTVTYGNGTPY